MYQIIKSDPDFTEHRNIIRRLRIVLKRKEETLSLETFILILKQHFPEYREAEDQTLKEDLKLLFSTCD